MKRTLRVLVLGLLLAISVGCSSSDGETGTSVSAEFTDVDNLVTAVVNLELDEDSIVEIEFLDEENYRMITDDETEFELEAGTYEFTISYNEIDSESSYNLFIYVNDEEYSYSYEGN